MKLTHILPLPVLLLAVTATTSHSAQIGAGQETDIPDSTISAAISPSRTSCKAPCYVYFDATSTTDTDTTKPIHHLLYCFASNDGETDTYSLAGHKTTQQSTFCGAPGWGYVFEEPGTWTPSLTVYAEDGDVATVNSTPIVVSDWDAADTTCVSQSGNFTGCPAGVPAGQKITSTDYDAYAQNTDRVLFRCDETFVASATVSFSSGGRFVGAFNNDGVVTERTCRYTLTKSGGDIFDLNRLDDIVVAGGERTGGGGIISDFISVLAGPSGQVSDFILVTNWVHSGASLASVSGGNNNDALATNMGFFGIDATCSGSAYCHYIKVEQASWVNNDYKGPTSHHIRLVQAIDTFIHNNKLHQSGGTVGHLIAIRAQEISPIWWGEHTFVSDNWIVSDVNWPIEIGGNSSVGTYVSHHRNHILERNYITGDASYASSNCFFGGGAPARGGNTIQNITIRNNICDFRNMVSGASFMAGEISTPGTATAEFYGNSAYSDSGSRAFFGLATNTCDVAKNNVFWENDGTANFSSDCATVTSGDSNWDTNGGETGVGDLDTCPFSTCPPTAVGSYELRATDTDCTGATDMGGNVTNSCRHGGTEVPNLFDFNNTFRDYVTPSVGAWENKRGTTP